MKNIIKIISVLLLSMTLINCGGNDGGSGDPAPADNGLTSGVTKIDYTNGTKKVSYESTIKDFSIDNRKKCLASSADDQSVSDVYAQLMAYVSSASIGKGSRDTVGPNPRYLTVTYSNNTTRTFNLNAESATVDQDILSNGDEISQYLDNLYSEINQPNSGNCQAGKGK